MLSTGNRPHFEAYPRFVERGHMGVSDIPGGVREMKTCFLGVTLGAESNELGHEAVRPTETYIQA